MITVAAVKFNLFPASAPDPKIQVCACGAAKALNDWPTPNLCCKVKIDEGEDRELEWSWTCDGDTRSWYLM